MNSNKHIFLLKIVYFLADLFAVHVGGDKNRMIFFEKNVASALEALQEKLFYQQARRRN